MAIAIRSYSTNDWPLNNTTDVNDQPINFIRDVQDSCIHVMLTAVDIHVHADNPPPFRMQLVLATLFLDPFVSTSINKSLGAK